ncbi:Disease resistance protein RPP13 [Triticum urartu]|uniref:Disease resistance protein RPP13 n=1 Tax=Triticum urartu TaxID=4572 RepID=M7Z329_TRIUA|nr:Disease resistance protein RPP13 [Triticum urartu]
MDVASGAMIPLIKKLGSLLVDEYNMEKRVKKGVKSLITELEMMHAVLRNIGAKPPEQFDEQVLILAGKEDSHDRGSTNMKNRVKKFLKKTTKLFTKGKALHQISDAIKEARRLAKELGDLRQRYMIDAQAKGTGDAIDPRLKAVYKDVTELVGIDRIRDELIKKLCDCDERSDDHLRTMSIVGFGGLGKTTLAKAVYDKIKVQFDSVAFVSVSRNPDMTKIFKRILYELDKNMYATINEAARDHKQLLDELRKFLQDKSCLGSRVMTTTRIGSISRACCFSGDDIIYQIKPLTDDDSKILFCKRIFPQGSKCPVELESVSKTILKKCGGVPLAIITIASILASNGEDQQVKPKYQWDIILGSIGRGLAEGGSAKDIEQNFATILDGTQKSKYISHNKCRRLSFHSSMSEPTTNLVDATSMPQTISCFQVLRVLDLEGCELGKNRHHIYLRYIENLLHLRYLGLRNTFARELPVEIGNLQFLETLGLEKNASSVAVIPSSVVRLRRLICLNVADSVLPVGIGNLTLLEELTGTLVDVKELGQLVELRVLYLYWNGDDESMCNSLVVSLGNLRKMHSLTILGLGDARKCTTTLPRWINSSSFPLLSSMSISVDKVRPEVDIQILGTLPDLRLLRLLTSKPEHTCVKTFVVGANAFPCLRECSFFGFPTGPSMFPRRAMSRLEILRFQARSSDIASGDLDVGMGHLPSLQEVRVGLWLEKGSSSDKCKGDADVVLRHAADTHPNRPTIHTYRYQPYLNLLEILHAPVPQFSTPLRRHDAGVSFFPGKLAYIPSAPSREIKASVRVVLPCELAKHAISGAPIFGLCLSSRGVPVS